MTEAPLYGMPLGEGSQGPAGRAAAAPPGARGGDYLEIKVEPMRAVLTILREAEPAGVVITREDVAAKLAGLQVVHGVDWTAVDRMIAGKQYDRGQIIAQGVPAKPGRDATIRENLKIDADVKPVLGKDGKADYKNVDNIHQVKKGDALAVKTPAVPGTEGKDIFGKTLPVIPAKDVPFKTGINTAVSADGLRLEAAVGGYVYHQAGAICVGVTYVLKGDVDYTTGNLHYAGDIQVMGNVTDGFMVEAEGDIIVEGTVEGAEVVSRGGSVTLKSGVFGHGKGRISGKSLRVFGAQDAKLECEDGILEVDKGLRNCQVKAKDVKADAPGCSVVGGEIKAYGKVSIAALGGEGCHTTIRIVDKEAEAAAERMKKVEVLLQEARHRLAPMETKLKGMKAMMARQESAMSERSKADIKHVAEAYLALKKGETDLEAEKEELAASMGASRDHGGRFAATEKIVWGGVLDIYGHVRELESEDAKKEWLLANGALIARSLIPEPGKPGPETPPPGRAPPA